jgi:hypothetical protein
MSILTSEITRSQKKIWSETLQALKRDNDLLAGLEAAVRTRLD